MKLERELLKDALWQWYLNHAEQKVGEVVRDYPKKLHIDPPPLFRVKYQEKRWGSCPKDDVLHINVRIIMAPMSQIEYVVAHELCHLKYKESLKLVRFYALVSWLACVNNILEDQYK